MTSWKRLSAALFIEFLRRLITNYPKKIFLVVDGLPAHKAKSVHRFACNAGERPPPDCSFSRRTRRKSNPDELVWNDVKNHGVARILIRAPRDLHRAVSSRLRLLQKKSRQSSRVLPDGNDALCSRLVPNIWLGRVTLPDASAPVSPMASPICSTSGVSAVLNNSKRSHASFATFLSISWKFDINPNVGDRPRTL